MERAASEQRILFAAVLEPTEARSSAFLRKVYKDRDVKRLAGETVNVVGVSGALRSGNRSPIKGLKWEALRTVEADLRDAHLSENEDDGVATPRAPGARRQAPRLGRDRP